MRDCFKDGLSSYCGAGFVDGIVNLALTRCKLTRRQILGCKFIGGIILCFFYEICLSSLF